MISPGAVAARPRLDGFTVAALVVTLVVYPALYCSGIIGRIVTPIFTENSRPHWWFFWLANMAFHWIPFAMVWIALRRNRESWTSIGVDWGWFVRGWVWVGLVLAALVLAFVMPGVHYGDALPARSRTIFMSPVSTPERLFIIFGAFTAAVTEEVLFRGFPFTRLSRVIPSPWLILPITVVSFLFIHGVPRDVQGLIAYTMAGLAFGVPFIFMGLRRLGVLIAIHFFIDAGMVIAP